MEPGKYNCLIVDDEPIARKIIVGYIMQLPFLSVAGECIHAKSALEYLKTNTEIDIIFLDINMPNLSGLQLVKIAKPRQAIVFTTAYAEHAVESYELNAVDYLLKPFSLERFTMAAHKAAEFVRHSKKTEAPDAENVPGFYVKSEGRNYPISIDEIIYCEAKRNYTMVVLRDGRKLMPLIPLSKFEQTLSEAGGNFIQVHRSFLISKKFITAIGQNAVALGETEIPIGVQFKERFFKSVGMKEN
jgi:DNA-binding LytR/AlgR family response regulator